MPVLVSASFTTPCVYPACGSSEPSSNEVSIRINPGRLGETSNPMVPLVIRCLERDSPIGLDQPTTLVPFIAASARSAGPHRTVPVTPRLLTPFTRCRLVP